MHGKKIILGISGSIAAYKAVSLCRLLIKSGAEVQVLMTENASQFISPLTLSTLSKRNVFSSVISESAWNNHVEMGLWADLIVIAPATANTIAKMANGICDNILAAVYLSARCQTLIAPAMDLDMWHHPATQKNIDTLKSNGVIQIPVGVGELASGLVGEGRMAEPEEIVTYISDIVTRQYDFSGKKIMITAGPTYEAIDPVRFIGNKSSGKMGVCLAEELSERGAEVVLILGPSNLQVKSKNTKVIHVTSAQEMYDASLQYFPSVDAAIMSAAVADYRPASIAENKIKKTGEILELKLIKNPDIAFSLGKLKTESQILVGFALETEHEEENARKKLEKKNLDFIVLNSLRDIGAGFQSDTNKITIYHQNNKVEKFELKSKENVAKDIAATLKTYFNPQ
ncbi:MAG: bifunctional phosphopantothenoylcysteine decarboxylase/phosphopantothenate--cysteine ligase CoaBC [Saprospiraceae bacterium]